MAKIQLTLSTKYVPSWDAWSAVREIVQNAMDGEVDGFTMKLSHSGNTLRVTNVGAKLDARVWLLGHSSKQGEQYRGQHGEGLKLGTLVLLRRGHDVKIINGDESWTPALEPSDTFGGEEVLTIYTHKRQNDSGAFTVEIGGIDKEAWELMKPRFLFLAQAKDTVETNYGSVLMDQALKGQVFVKGIYVQNDPNLNVGYDFKHVSVDRDRRLVSSWDLRYYAAKAWEEALTKRAIPTSKVVELLEKDAPDVAGLTSEYTSAAVSAEIGEVFKTKHGDDAVPVLNMAEAREIAHYGKRGVVVPQSFAEVLRKTAALQLETVRQEGRFSITASYGWDDLSNEERVVYTKAVALVEQAAQVLGFGSVESRLNIVDFQDASLEGTFKAGQIKVAKRMLADFEDFLATLVHEVAHAQGGDGEVGHERAEGKIFSRIIALLQKN